MIPLNIDHEIFKLTILSAQKKFDSLTERHLDISIRIGMII